MFDDENDDAGDWQARVQSARLTELMLGAAMRSPELAQTLIACGFDDEDMPEAPHRAIWKAVWKAHTRGKVVDHNLVEADIVAAGMDAEKAREFILACRRDIDEPESPKIVAYVEEVKRRVALRRIAKLGREMIRKADEPDVAPGPIVATATQDLDAILRGAAVIRAAHGEELERLGMRVFEKKDKPSFVPLGLSFVDGIVGGAKRGGITLFSAQEKAGKTTLGLRNLLHVLRSEVCLHISLEAKDDELMQDISQMRAGIQLPVDLDTTPAWMRSRYAKACSEVSSMPLFIEKLSYPTAEQLAALVCAHVRKNGVTFVQIDYVQNINHSTRQGSEERSFAHHARVLAGCADSCRNTAFVCFSQMKNTSDGKGGKIEHEDPVPQTSEWKRAVYFMASMKRNQMSPSEDIRNTTTVSILANRINGRSGKGFLRWVPDQRRSYEVDEAGHRIDTDYAGWDA